MTERESQEFYNDLRHKLQDYGSPPPESVWAGIRQQVPARRRRWWRGALLVLLLTGFVAYLTGTLRPWRSATSRKPAARLATSSHNTATATARPGSVAPNTPLTIDPTASAQSNIPAAAPATPLGGATTLHDGAGSLPGSPKRVSSKSVVITNGIEQLHPAAVTDSTARRRPAATVNETSVKASAHRLVAAAMLPPRAAAGGTERRTTGRQFAKASKLITTAARQKAEADSQSKQAVISPTPLSAADKQQGVVSAEVESLVYLRPVALQPLPFGAPTVQRVVTDSVPVAPRFRRWMVEVLAGPAVSYRRLGPDSLTTNQLERLERPALTFAAQAQFRYAVTPRLSVSAGLGYTQYATKFNFVLRKQAIDSLPPTSEAVQRYDTYRYLTIPLQARYLLRQHGRFQYSVLGGGALGLYLGGRTSSGTACACEQQRWVGANSPYQAVNLSVNGGLEVRYQVAPGWSVLAQPSFQYSVRSISKAQASGAARYPFAAGLLTGFSYNLR